MRLKRLCRFLGAVWVVLSAERVRKRVTELMERERERERERDS
jgi:hypothetical protein